MRQAPQMTLFRMVPNLWPHSAKGSKAGLRASLLRPDWNLRRWAPFPFASTMAKTDPRTVASLLREYARRCAETIPIAPRLTCARPAPIASEALRRIAELYRVEDDIRGQPADARRVVRQERSRPILAELKLWLHEKLGLISQKTKFAEAIRFTLSRWEGLSRFLDEGRIEIDSNTVERSIRPIALNRKNALFAGSDGGAEH